MVFIHDGRPSSKLSPFLKPRMIDCSLNAKKLLGRTLRGRSESYNLDSPFVALLVTWIERSWEWLWRRVLYSTTWLSKKNETYDLAFEYEDVEDSIPGPIVRRNPHPCYAAYLCRVVEIRDPELHAPLQSNLKQEIWRWHRHDKDHNRNCYVFLLLVIFFLKLWTILYCYFCPLYLVFAF